MELNPNHPTVRSAHDHWHKITAVLMKKFGTDHVVITHQDIERFVETDGMFVVLQELADGLHLRFVTEAEAHRLARKHGGLPT